MKRLLLMLKNLLKTRKMWERQIANLEIRNQKERDLLCFLVKDLLTAIEDNTVTSHEITELRKRAYTLLIAYDFDKR